MKLDNINMIKNRFYKIAYLVIDDLAAIARRFFNKILFEDENIINTKDSLKYWKNKIFYIVAIAMITLGAPLLFYGASIFYSQGKIAYAMVEVLIYFVIAIVVTRKSLSVRLRKIFIIQALYFIRLLLLITTGLMGSGMVCVFFSLILTGCLLDKKQILQVVTINIIIFIALTALLMYGCFSGTLMETYKDVWFINAITAQACGIILLYLMNRIYSGLENQTQLINKSKESLIASEIKHIAMIANIVDVIIIVDESGVVKYNSPNLEQRFGWRSEDISNKPLWEDIHSEDRNRIKGELQSILEKDGLEKTMEVRYICKNGRIKDIVLTAVNLTKDPNIKGILINYHDITQRKLNEAKIKESEEKYKEVVENIPLGIISFDTSGKINYINNAVLEIMGSPSRDSYIGVNVLTHPHLVKWGHAEFHRKSIESGTLNVLETEYESIFGKKVYIRGQDAPIKDSSGKVTGNIFIIDDFTQRKKIEKELIHAKEKAEAANCSKSQFLANMSHEIRTPLNGIMGMLQLLNMTELTKEQADYTKVSKISSDSLLKVINDILDYSKIEAGKLELEKNNFKLNELINDLDMLFYPTALNKGIILDTHIEVNVPDNLIGDSFKLRQILSNLIGNALKFTNVGRIDLVIRNVTESGSEEIKLEFSIKDTGIGIKRDKIDEIFKSFSQADSTTTRCYGGTGLGLAICKGLVEKMKGEIWVESKETEGSAFNFTCVFEELKDEKNMKAKNIQNIVADINEDLIKLLIVEDNEIGRMVMEKLARRKGWNISLAQNGKEAIDIYRKEYFDVIFMDIQMPVLDGYKATGIIRQLQRQKSIHTPIIAMTANALKGDREKCIEAGMDDYMAKPIDANEFYNLIEKWTKNKKKVR